MRQYSYCILLRCGVVVLKAQVGDKVRVKGAEGPFRGVIVRIQRNAMIVQIDDTGKPIRVNEDDLTNLSLAARRAWQSMPTRQVGRKLGVKIRDRVSVTVRFDRDLWTRFRELEETGQIKNRTDFINKILREAIEASSTKSIAKSDGAST